MLKCREVAELANDYIDMELPWHKTMAISLHLSVCKHCSGFVKKLRLVITLLQEKPRETLSDKNANNIVKNVLGKHAETHNKGD